MQILKGEERANMTFEMMFLMNVPLVNIAHLQKDVK